MKNEVPIRKLYHIVPQSGTMAGHTAAIPSQHAHYLRVMLDFAAQHYSIDGDWRYLVQLNAKSGKNWERLHQPRVRLQGHMYLPISIADEGVSDFSMVCSLEGNISDEAGVHVCTGLLVIDQKAGSDGHEHQNWEVTLYLYDHEIEECELVIKLPLSQVGLDDKDLLLLPMLN